MVNDTPIYVRGFNWIPDDALLTRLDPRRYRTSIKEAVAAGANLMRIWGGGIYESDDFYDVCDELGDPGLAGLPVRLRGLQRGRAAAQ